MNIKLSLDKDKFSLNTKNTSYIFALDDNGLLRHIYWGKKIENVEEIEVPILSEVSTNDPVYEITPEEFPIHGNLRYKENCLKLKFYDGSRGSKFEYKSYKIENDQLDIELFDEAYGIKLILHYRVLAELDLIERWVTLENLSKEVLEIVSIYSAQFHIPYRELNLRNTHGHWGAEHQLFKQKLNYGKIVLENRRGISTHNHNPYFILDRDATETSGEVYFGALKFSGNFKGVVEQTQYEETTVSLGLNDYDFMHLLQPGENFVTPIVVSGYTNKGLETMSHRLHTYGRRIMRDKQTREVLYNSWEATEFKVCCDEQIKLAKSAAELGTELFVVDDGWFGRRDSIEDGLGDWWINSHKFPNGLKPLIDEVKGLGMKFGIWIEPEMVNPATDLYKAHPDWIYSLPKRVTNTSRGQYVLNLSKKEVSDFIFNMIDELLSKNDIDYIKWDANRPISQASIEQDIWYKHIVAVYEIVDKVKAKYPHVLMEACASGGGRIDFGALEHFDDFWTSDNTDALDRITIQDSYSYIYPIKAMRAWVTDVPNFLSRREIPLKFRYHSAMMGTLGIGCKILNFTTEEINLSKEMIKEYKEIRETVQEGDFYRLENTSTNNYKFFQYTREKETLLFAFLTSTKIGHKGANIKLRALDKNKVYTFVLNGEEVSKSGNYLMNIGIDIRLVGDYDSLIVKLK
ncbi:MAG: alpha-galactosidase [Fusobacteriaceae bacterium]